MISASAIYREAARLKPAATGVVSADSHCIMCGAPLPAGTPGSKVTKQTFNDAFNNQLDLRARSGEYVCGDCEVLWCKDWMQKYSKTFACPKGVFKFASNDHIAGFLLNPPEPPFVAIVSNKQQQHMIWRAPVNLSRELLLVLMDHEVLTIRTRVLYEACKVYAKIEQLMEETKLARTGRKLKKPAALFERTLSLSRMGSLRPDVLELLVETGNESLAQPFLSLSMGEWWALGVLRFYDLENPPAHENALA